jgi:hypothetical protein
MTDGKTHTGACLCGAVKYQVRNLGGDVVASHCGQCRRQSGHYFASVMTTRVDLTITEDRGLKWYCASDAARRGFCAECGAILFWESATDESYAICAGSLDGPTGLKLASHIFVDDKGDYYDIDDGLPQFHGYDRPVATGGGS